MRNNYVFNDNNLHCLVFHADENQPTKTANSMESTNEMKLFVSIEATDEDCFALLSLIFDIEFTAKSFVEYLSMSRD